MKKAIRNHKAAVIAVLTFGLAVSMIAAVGLGPVKIPFLQVWEIIAAKITGNTPEGIGKNIIVIVWQLRVPRVILGGIVGAGLALSGVGMQSFTRNPLSGPYVLGISSGASAGAVISIVLGIKIFGRFSLPIGAFVGALITIFLVFTLSRNRDGSVIPIKLILTGIAVSALFSAFTNYLIFTSKHESGIRSATFWMMGGLAGAKWAYVTVPFVILAISILTFMLISNALNALLIGDTTAQTLGINVKRTRMTVIIITALLTGAVVSVSGCISFVGLVIPHIVRNIMGTDHKIVVPVSSLVGAIFLIWADVFARTAAGTSELPIGILTAICGAPFFIWLVRKSEYSFGD